MKKFSIMLLTTYDCNCNCPYCIVPKVDIKSMSPETFEKIFFISERLIDKGIYDQIKFRLSGGETFLVFNNYKNQVTKWNKKMGGRFIFGALTNLTWFSDEMAEWMAINNIGCQVSLDSMDNSKPLKNGKSSSETALKNIIKLQKNNIPFAVNTVIDPDKVDDLTTLANYVSSLNITKYGLTFSDTLNDPKKIDKITYIIKNCIDTLKKNNFDFYNKFRCCSVPFNNDEICTVGAKSVTLGANLEVWPCHSMIDKKPLGYYSENIDALLKSGANKYFYNRTLLKECIDCGILGVCKGGCRVTHCYKEITQITCRIRREIINYIFKTIPGLNNKPYYTACY